MRWEEADVSGRSQTQHMLQEWQISGLAKHHMRTGKGKQAHWQVGYGCLK